MSKVSISVITKTNQGLSSRFVCVRDGSVLRGYPFNSSSHRISNFEFYSSGAQAALIVRDSACVVALQKRALSNAMLSVTLSAVL